MSLKGVILAAGYGSRFFPITKTIPKEMLPLINKPAISYITEEFEQAGIQDVLIITHRKKKALEDYFDSDSELNHFLMNQNKSLALEKIQPPNLNIMFARQKEMKGTADALLLAKSFVKDDPFILAFPDDIVLSKTSLSLQLKQQYDKYKTSILATEYIDGDVSRYGVLEPGENIDSKTFYTNGIIEKPNQGMQPSQIITIGRYLLSSNIFNIIESIRPQSTEGEFYLTDALQELALNKSLIAHNYDGIRLDTGEPESYLKSLLYLISQSDDYKYLLDGKYHVKEYNSKS